VKPVIHLFDAVMCADDAAAAISFEKQRGWLMNVDDKVLLSLICDRFDYGPGSYRF